MWLVSLVMLYMFHLHHPARAACKVGINVSASQVVQTESIQPRGAEDPPIWGISQSNKFLAMLVFLLVHLHRSSLDGSRVLQDVDDEIATQ